MAESTVQDRIRQYIDYKNISVRQFEIQSEMYNGFVGNIKRTISNDVVDKIRLVFPDLNKACLLTGEGEMLNTNNTHQNQQAMNQDELIKNLQEQVIYLREELKSKNNQIDQLMESNRELTAEITGNQVHT